MSKRPQPGQAWRKAVLASLFAIGLLAAGCQHTPPAGTAPPPDPLFGQTTPPGLPKPTSSSQPSPVSGQPAPQTFIPRANPTAPTSTNPATLAATSWTSPGSPALALNDYNGPSFLPTSGKRSNDYLPPNPNPRVEAVPDAGPAPTKAAPTNFGQAVTPTPTPTLPINPASSGDSLAKELQARGVVNQKQEQVADGIRLTCYISRGPAGGLRILEVTAVDYPTAARAIIQQIDSTR